MRVKKVNHINCDRLLKTLLGTRVLIAACFFIRLISYECIYAQDLVSEKLDDGVVRYYNPDSNNERSRIYSFFEKLFNNFTGDVAPFGKSVAFLAGVSSYDDIGPQLKWVKNDLQDMKNFLLSDGGFDEVYIAEEKIVNADLLNNYMRNFFPNNLDKNDRLLFYYAGHGDDNRGKKGYLQFSGASNKNFVGNQVLSIDSIVGWCDELPIKHLLIMLDSCASGLARRGDGSVEIVNRLSKYSSRIIMTAGTGDQDTFEISNNNSSESGNGVFTKAFLNVLSHESRGIDVNGFLTIDEVYGQMKNIITAYARDLNVELDPDLIHYKKLTNPGTFVFVNPNVDLKNIQPAVRDFDYLFGTIRSSTDVKPSPKHNYQFRSKQKKMSPEEVESMLRKNDFYAQSDSHYWPKYLYGNGINHKFKVIKNGLIILDSFSSLMWTTELDEVKKYNVEGAESYIRRLNKVHFGGFNDWRLPTLEETMSIMERERNSRGVYLNIDFYNFTYTKNSRNMVFDSSFWTADLYDSSKFWFVNFWEAEIEADNNDSLHSVFAVRNVK